MHTNYYFLRRLAPALEPLLTGLRFMECFSQDRDEVVLVFAQARGKVNYYKPFYIKATLRPDFSGLLFPPVVQRARTNSVDLMQSLVEPDSAGLPVVGVRAFLNERCIAILLEGDRALLFKFFGNRPNLLAVQAGNVVELFNHKLVADERIRLDALDRPLDQSYDAFERADFDHRPLFPTFGKVVNRWLADETQRRTAEQGGPLTGSDRWALLQEVVRQLETPRFFLTRLDHQPALSLLPIGDVQRELDDTVEAANWFYIAYNGLSTFEREKADLLRLLDKRRRRAEALIDANLHRLIAREEGPSHEEMGHILMAHLHEIPEAPGARSPERVTLTDFYRDQPNLPNTKPRLKQVKR